MEAYLEKELRWRIKLIVQNFLLDSLGKDFSKISDDEFDVEVGVLTETLLYEFLSLTPKK